MNTCLRREREKRGWTTREVVRRLKVEAYLYIGWERDWREPSWQEIAQLCQLFECAPLTIGYLEESDGAT